MIHVPTQLNETAKKVHKQQRTRAVKVRRFLSWFGAKRRGAQGTRDIRTALKKVRLITEPDFLTANIEGVVKFRPDPTFAERSRPTTRPRSAARLATEKPATVTDSDKAIEISAQVQLSDPTPRLGTIFGGQKPMTVSRNDELTTALTLMANHDFSQLPVMNGDRHVDGVISWKTIGDAILLRKNECQLVGECMEHDVAILPFDCPLPRAIKTIADNEVVLVRDDQLKLTGIVTHYDLAERYHGIAEPYLLLAEIETNLRQMILLANIPLATIKEAKDPKDLTRTVNSVSDLTFGEYVRLLDDAKNWTNIHLNLSRKTFMSAIRKIAKIRNEVMHFSPDPLERESLTLLRSTAKMMRGFKLFGKTVCIQ